MIMRAGDLIDVVRWHKRVVEVQRSGAVKESYDDFGDLRCSIKPPGAFTEQNYKN